MITRSTAVKAVLFVVITVALVLYIGAAFLGLFGFIGARDYTVRMRLGNASGLFERGEVTFRGVDVGAVGPLTLTEDGVQAALVINGSASRIPADLQAVVASRSAVGERYVDLRPNVDDGPYLRDGDVITPDHVTLPVPVEDVLTNLDRLVASVPLNDLRTVVGELGQGFDGLGPKLQALLDSTNSLTDSATENLPQTLALIRDARTVLRTQNELADPIRSFSSDLKLVTRQLADSDPDIRRLLRTGPDAGREVSALLDESGDGLGRTIKELLTLGQITRARLDGIRFTLVAYPMFTAMVPTFIPGDGTAHLGLVLNVNDPPPCTNGYQATHKRPGTDTGPQQTNYRAYCREPIFSPTDVRGIKPQYPFVNGRPQPPPEWFSAFYTDGPAAGIEGPPARVRGGSDHGYSSRSAANPAPEPALPGLLSAPALDGQFGLTPTLPSNG